ncbi:MAG: carbohydrate deacetylase [Stellaceae bacterium]
MAGLIVNADDLGIHPETNRGILDAYGKGILTSATLLVTTPYLSQTIRDVVRTSDLPVGLHLSLTLGTAVAPASRVPDLVDEAGQLRHSALKMVLLGPASGHNRAIYDQIEVELTAQLAVAHDHGLRPTHVDTHQHVHANPVIHEIVEKVAERYGVKRMRACREPFFAFEFVEQIWQNTKRKNPIKWALVQLLQQRIRPRLKQPDGFFGLFYSGTFTKRAFRLLIEHLPRDQVIEVGIHPGYAVSPGDARSQGAWYHPFSAAPEREQELELLLDPELRSLLTAHGIHLMSFADL